MQLRSGLLLVWLACGSVLGYPKGPPSSVCSSLRPGHPGEPASGNGGYVITTDLPARADKTGYDFEAGRSYTVTLTGLRNTFRGFAVRSVSVPGNGAIGEFTPQNANQQILSCQPRGATIVHSNPVPSEDFSSQQFVWTAPNSQGTVDFLYTVVRTNPGDYYVMKSAIAEFSDGQIDTTDEDGAMDMIEYDLMDFPDGVTLPTTQPDDYSLIFKNPTNCDISDCTVYVGIERNEGNSSYLNFYIEGDAAAWVAVGFSHTSNMPNTDVMACNRIAGGEEVEVLDGWNPGYYNVISNVSEIFAFNTSVIDGRIFCRFGRSIAGNGDAEHFNLDENYYVLFGHSNGQTSTHFLRSHLSGSRPVIPSISERQYNVVRDSGTAGASSFERVKRALVRAHGIFMLIAFFLLVNIGTHFAWYMRLPLPNGEWFQVHRAVMIAALFISVTGMIFIFVSQARNSPPGLVNLSDNTKKAHLIIGIIVVFLQILNPILAIFRCHPGEKYRWVFNVFHGKIVGQWVQILGMTNIGIGLSLFSEDFSRFGDLTLLWIFVAYIIINILFHFILIPLVLIVGRKHCGKCYSRKDACTCGKSAEAVKYKEADETVALTTPTQGGRKKPAEGSSFIWITMLANIGTISTFTLVFLVLIALP